MAGLDRSRENTENLANRTNHVAGNWMSHLVHALGHIKISTRDIDAVVRDATEILGLHVTHSDARQTWLSSNGRAAELDYVPVAA